MDEAANVVGMSFPVDYEGGLADLLSHSVAYQVHPHDWAVRLAYDLHESRRSEDLALPVPRQVVLVHLHVAEAVAGA